MLIISLFLITLQSPRGHWQGSVKVQKQAGNQDGHHNLFPAQTLRKLTSFWNTQSLLTRRNEGKRKKKLLDPHWCERPSPFRESKKLVIFLILASLINISWDSTAGFSMQRLRKQISKNHALHDNHKPTFIGSLSCACWFVNIHPFNHQNNTRSQVQLLPLLHLSKLRLENVK